MHPPSPFSVCFTVQIATWLILTFHKLFNDEDKAGCRGRFMTALAWSTHSCTQLAAGPPPCGWLWRWCWGAWEMSKQENKERYSASELLSLPAVWTDMYTCGIFPVRSDGQPRLAHSNIPFSGCRCTACVNAAFQATRKIGI